MNGNVDSFRTMIKPLTMLVVASGAAQGTQITVPPGGLLLGRDGPAEGRLGDDPALSRQHAMISHSGQGDLVISDMGSANGTFLNGSRVGQPTPVRPGDVIELGSTRLQAIGSAPGAPQTQIANPHLAPAQHGPGGQQFGQQYAPVPGADAYGRFPAAAVPEGMLFDHASGLVLPQGTQLATVGRRIGAFFLTLPLPFIFGLGVVASINSWSWGLRISLLALVLAYLVWGIFAWSQGQTPALQLLGMRCWRPETRRVAGFGTMALREIIGRTVDSFLLISLPFSFLLFLIGKEHKSLHDHIAGTVVVYDPNQLLSR
jgi:uncharacterized RDD family membrane protein YckC